MAEYTISRHKILNAGRHTIAVIIKGVNESKCSLIRVLNTALKRKPDNRAKHIPGHNIFFPICFLIIFFIYCLLYQNCILKVILCCSGPTSYLASVNHGAQSYQLCDLLPSIFEDQSVSPFGGSRRVSAGVFSLILYK